MNLSKGASAWIYFCVLAIILFPGAAEPRSRRSRRKAETPFRLSRGQRDLSCNTSPPETSANPVFSRGCSPDLRIVLILDESGSIDSSGSRQVVIDAAMTFWGSLPETYELAIFEFGSSSRSISGGFKAATAANKAVWDAYIQNPQFNSASGYEPSGRTNWEQVLDDVVELNKAEVEEERNIADFVFFFTDGLPTKRDTLLVPESPISCGSSTSCRTGQGCCLPASILSANELKEQGSHLMGVLIGIESELAVCSMRAVSGPLEFVQGVRFQDADYVASSFGDFVGLLGELAQRLCSVDLEIAVSIEQEIVVEDEVLTVNVEVSNSGTEDATGVVVDLNAGEGLTYISQEPAEGGYDEETGTIDVGNLPAGGVDPYQVSISFNVEDGSNSDITLSVSGDQPDVDGAEDGTLALNSADVEVSLVGNDQLVLYGQQVQFVLTASCQAISTDCSGVSIEYSVPSGYSLESSSVSQGFFDESSGIWSGVDLGDGESEQLVILATVQAFGEYEHSAVVSSTEGFIDADLSNNYDSWATQARPDPQGDEECEPCIITCQEQELCAGEEPSLIYPIVSGDCDDVIVNDYNLQQGETCQSFVRTFRSADLCTGGELFASCSVQVYQSTLECPAHIGTCEAAD